MRTARTLGALAALAAALAADGWLAGQAFGQGRRLKPRSFGGAFEPSESAPAPRASERPASYQNIRRLADAYLVEYVFRNFNEDSLKVGARFDDKAVADSIREFGVRQKDFEILDLWYQESQESAIERAKASSISGQIRAPDQAALAAKLREAKAHNARVQAQLDAALNDLAKEYRRRRQQVYKDAGFRYKGENTVGVDIPALVGKSAPRVRPLAQDFARIAAERGYETEDLVGAVTSMVQTAMRYEVPDLDDGTRTIGGVLPPLKALVMGQGDCDTKTAVLASVLKSWPNLKMIGLEIPEHYLMALHRIPRRGEAYLEYQGLPYVMIEAAGPAQLAPGSVGDTTQGYIDSGNDFNIQTL